jgi:hypothetical protein
MLRVSHNFPQGRDRAEEPIRNAGAWGSRAGRHRFPEIILGRNEWFAIKFGVFGLAKPKLPITEEQGDWIDRSSYVLAVWLGRIDSLKPNLCCPRRSTSLIVTTEAKQRCSKCFIGLLLECT